MYRHFFKTYGLRFALFVTALLIFTAVLNNFLVEGKWQLNSLSDMLSYYAVMFSCVILAGVMVKGFNNRIVLALIIVASISEQAIASLMFTLSPTLHTAIAMIYVPGILTMVMYQYRLKFQFWVANQLIRSERLREAGFKLLDKTEDTGLQLMARLPGKKNTKLSQLSGGEKALTALALVFSLFSINPAPFCLLDEVDAPLDDENTSRFINLVNEMSEKVQFIFVTHNKISMEKSTHLLGVTMRDLGVSKVVSVDVEQAMELAQS